MPWRKRCGSTIARHWRPILPRVVSQPVLLTLVAAFAVPAASALAQTRGPETSSFWLRGLVTEGDSEAERLWVMPRDPASSIGQTGFDSTGRAGRSGRLRPGERNVGLRSIETRQVPPMRGVPQQEAGRPVAPQQAARSVYADAYRPPDYMAPGRRPQRTEIDAYDPVGVRVGAFELRPAIEVSYGRDSNPGRSSGGGASGVTVVAPELVGRSDWVRHELSFDLRGTYRFFETDSALDRPQGHGRVNGRIDVTRDTKIELEGRGTIGTDDPGSPNVPVGVSRLPTYTAFGGTAGVVQSFNRLELSARALVDRLSFRDSKLVDGSTFPNRDRNYNQYGAELRAGYELTPDLRPFVAVGIDQRVHDEAVDRNGYRRDSEAITPRAGLTFETGKLRGELSVGYLMRDYKDPALKKLNGVVADGSLVWRATGLTTATLSATSRVEESAVPSVSGALRRDAGLRIDHAFRRWLIGTVEAGYGLDEYVGLGRNDTRTSLGVALAYKLNRSFWLKGEFRQEWMRSSEPAASYDASTFLIGMRMQR